MSTAQSPGDASEAAKRRPLWRRLARLGDRGPRSPRRSASREPVLAPYRQKTSRTLFKAIAYGALALFCLVYGAQFAVNAPRLMVVFATPIALTAALGIWALPSGDYAPTTAIRWLFFAFASALMLWPNYLAIALPGLPWITLIRLTGAPLVVALLIAASASPKFRSEIAEVLRGDIWAFRLLLGFVIVEGLTIALSKNPGNSLSRFMVSQINWTGIFFAGCYVFRRPGAVQVWAKLLLGAGAVLCVLGLWESRHHMVLWTGHIPSFLKIGDESVMKSLAGLSRAYGNMYRVQVTAGTPLGLAEFLGLTIPFAMHFALSKYKPAMRMFAAVYIPLAVWVIILTDSRLGIVASLVSVVVYLLLWSVRRWRTSKTSIFAPALVISYPAIFCAFVAATFLIGRLRRSVWGGGAQQASTDSRKQQWEMAIPKLMRAPLGNGQGNSGNVLGYVAMDGTLTVDSYYITLLMDYGIPGFVLYLGLFLRTAWTGGTNGFRVKEDQELMLMMPLAVALVNFVVIKSVFSQEDNHPLVFMMVAATLALVYRSRQADAAAAASELAAAPSRNSRH